MKVMAGGRLLLLAALLAPGGCGSPQERGTKAVARFDAYYAAGQYWQARTEISSAIARQDDVPEYWRKLGRVQLALGKYLEAYNAYSRVIELDRTDAEALQAMAELSYSGDSLDDALTYANRMLEQQPSNLRMLLVKGSVAVSREDLAGAHAIVSRMREIDPSNEGAAILMARVFNAGGERARAIDTLEESVAKDGETSPKLMVLADLHVAAGDFPRIARTYARLFALNPGNAELRLEYARVLYEHGRPDRALALIDRLARAHPGDATIQQRIVDLWTEAGSAGVDLDRVGRFVATGDDQMKIAFGHLAIDQRRFVQAEQVLRPFVDGEKISAGNVEADVLYAAALSGLGRGAEAQALIDRVLAFDSTNPRALLMRVRIALAAGKLDQAVRDAQILVRDNPDRADARIALAQVYVRRNERILADGTYARAMNDLPGDATMLAAYLAYLAGSGRKQMAFDVAADFTTKNSRSRDGWRERARLCRRLGDERCVAASLDALDLLRGGSRVRRAIEAAREPVAGQAGRLCGKTGQPC